MKLGIISDVHANIIALEAVLARLREAEVDQIICLGDLVGYGTAPNEVIERLQQEQIDCTLGGSDEQLAFDFAARKRNGVADKTIAWTRSVIEPQHISYLRELPIQARLRTPIGRLRYFHSTMHSTNDKLDAGASDKVLNKLLEECKCRILVFGRSHVPVAKKLDNGWLINPGSVGLSLNGEPGADYVVVDITPDKVDIHMDKAEYDYAAVGFEIASWGLPEVIIEAVRLGRMPIEQPKVRIHKIGRGE